jgi:hypothetical protein
LVFESTNAVSADSVSFMERNKRKKISEKVDLNAAE